MPKIILVTLALATASLVISPALTETGRLKLKIVLENTELKLTPAALAFNKKGELYVAYRDEGSDRKSSAIWVRVFDPVNGEELRSTQISTVPVPLANGANQFLFSPDNSLLLYSQFYGSPLITILNAATLEKESETNTLPQRIDKEFPKVVGISPDNASVLVSAEVDKDFPPGVFGVSPDTGAVIVVKNAKSSFRMHGMDTRLVRLDSHDLSHVLSDATLTNPIPESGFVVAPDGTVRIIGANMLYRYDLNTKQAALEHALHNHDDIRNGLFLDDHSLLLWSGQNEFGYLYRFKQGDSTLERSRRIEKSGVENVLLSPDQLYGVALCEHQNLNERRFGTITSRTGLVFDTNTLKIIAEVPIERNLYPELAIWHAGGRIVVATQASSNKLAIYEFVDQAHDTKPVSVTRKDGSR